MKLMYSALVAVAALLAGCGVFELDGDFVYCDELYGYNPELRDRCFNELRRERFEQERREQCIADWDEGQNKGRIFDSSYQAWKEAFLDLNRRHDERGCLGRKPRQCSTGELADWQEQFRSLRERLERLRQVYADLLATESKVDSYCRQYSSTPDEPVMLHSTIPNFDRLAQYIDGWTLRYTDASGSASTR